MKFASLFASAFGLLAVPAAHANVAMPRVVLNDLIHEEVRIEIKGDEGVVTGTFKFENNPSFYADLHVYLPVYAAPGTPIETIMPEITQGEHKLGVRHVPLPAKQDPEQVEPLRLYILDTAQSEIAQFGELPQLEGQEAQWFVVAHLPQEAGKSPDEPGQKEITLKIRYTQKLAKGKFIYTPLIPHQKEGKDYGSITVSADRKLSLLESEKHSFVEEEGKFVVDPSDKRAIVVEVAKAAPQLP